MVTAHEGRGTSRSPNAPADVALVRAALDTADAEPVDVTLANLSVIELHRDNLMYQWTTVATVPIGT
jgi:hypothetical protein